MVLYDARVFFVPMASDPTCAASFASKYEAQLALIKRLVATSDFIREICSSIKHLSPDEQLARIHASTDAVRGMVYGISMRNTECVFKQYELLSI